MSENERMNKIISGRIYGMRDSLYRIKSKRNSSMLHNEPEKFIKGGLSSFRKNKFK